MALRWGEIVSRLLPGLAFSGSRSAVTKWLDSEVKRELRLIKLKENVIFLHQRELRERKLPCYSSFLLFHPLCQIFAEFFPAGQCPLPSRHTSRFPSLQRTMLGPLRITDLPRPAALLLRLVSFSKKAGLSSREMGCAFSQKPKSGGSVTSREKGGPVLGP